MSKVKVKKIKITPEGCDKGVAEMFNQMLGTGTVNMSIAYPKYIRLRDLCNNLIKLFKIVASSPIMQETRFDLPRKQLEKFCEEAANRSASLFNMNFKDYEWNLTLVEGEQLENFTVAYDKMKKDDLLRTFIATCNKLVPYRIHFENPKAFNCKFITSMPGAEWKPFSFTSLNLKDVFTIEDLGVNTTAFFMTVLHKCYMYSRRIYDELQSPDIDVDAFVDIITKNIDDIQRQPELHRCKEAFKKIKDSITLLKTNFNGYYRDFISTSDSTIIMQHFILDVSKDTHADARVSSQFRTIINYYRKIASEQKVNPKMKAFLDRVDISFKSMEKDSANIVKINEDEKTIEVEDDGGDIIINGTYCTGITGEDLMESEVKK